jgi:hypothetical protein
MTLQWIPLDRLQRHPENSNRMPPRLMEKLKRHIQRTGLYEPLVVRPLDECGVRNAECGVNGNNMPPAVDSSSLRPSVPSSLSSSTPHSALATPHCLYQLLNGHHRAEVLRQLGHTHARCDVWVVSDEDALLLLATLNRLEGRDDPAARARLVAKLAGDRSPEDLARLLPEPADAVERLLKLSEPPPEPLTPDAAALAARPMTFFLTEEQHSLVREALAEAARGSPLPLRERVAEGRVRGASDGQLPRTPNPSPSAGGGGTGPAPDRPCSRSEAVERIALWYLQARSLR